MEKDHILERNVWILFCKDLKYITDEGKFDREKFNKDKNSRFL